MLSSLKNLFSRKKTKEEPKKETIQEKKDNQPIEPAKKIVNKIIQKEEKLESSTYVEDSEIEDTYKEKGEVQISWMDRLKIGLKKTREGFLKNIEDFLMGKAEIDDELIEDLEELLIQADIGVETSGNIINFLEEKVEDDRLEDPSVLNTLIKNKLKAIFSMENKSEFKFKFDGRLNILLMIGVNGVGKTTTIGKIASKYKKDGKKIMLVAGDTFRAAAIDQLEIWAKRNKAGIIKAMPGADPAAVVFDGIKSAKSKKADLLIVDTAGRLHTKINLMEELKKIKRIIQKEAPEALLETTLVLDATTGQNGLSQAQIFNKELDIDGIILTKLDGTAKGGVIVGIKNKLKLPIKMIGIGEKIDDLRPFSSKEFIEALFS